MNGLMLLKKRGGWVKARESERKGVRCLSKDLRKEVEKAVVNCN